MLDATYRNVGLVTDDMVSISQEVNRLLLGLNCGRAIDTLDLPESAKALSSEYEFDLQVVIYPRFAIESL